MEKTGINLMGLKRPIPANIERKQISLDEWQNRGRELFGEDIYTWKFKCASCGNIQSYESIRKNNPQIGHISESMVYFSCEGRINKAINCDWTLGGLFK